MNINNEQTCIDLSDGWYVKIGLKFKNSIIETIEQYIETKYIEILSNLSCDDIQDVRDIFKYLILPKPFKDQYGNDVEWVIIDYENLYAVNELDKSYWNKTQNPICFETDSESMLDPPQVNRMWSYFDDLMANF